MNKLLPKSRIHSMDYSCENETEEHDNFISVQKFPTKLSLTDIHISEKSKFMIETLVRIVQPISKYLEDYIFILTNDFGIVLQTFGLHDVLSELEDINIGPGYSFALPHAGINAISLAMELHEMVSVTGTEHQLDLFYSWKCLCKPIFLHDHIIGYLNLSMMDIETEFTFAIPLLELLVTVLERELGNCPSSKELNVDLLFADSGFTKREHEVGRLWLQNLSAYNISQTLYISEGTVRNVIKKIYAKSGVCDKCSFLRKFLID